MGGITKTLFGSPSKSRSESFSAFQGLPGEAQTAFKDIANTLQGFIPQAGSFSSPIDLTQQEQMAGMMIDPANFGSSVGNYLNPFRDIITQDINEAFGDQSSAFRSRASEAGAFGSSRMREGEADLERARMDAIARAQADQFNMAANQQQQGILNLLGFGGLQRNIDLQQSLAPLTDLQTMSQILGIIPTSGSSLSTSRGARKGLIDYAAQIAGGASGAAGGV